MTKSLDDRSSIPSASVQEASLVKQVRFITALTADPEVAAHGKAVANALVFKFWNRTDGYARPGHAKIVEAAGVPLSSVKRGIQSLQDRGWFVVEPAWDAKGDPAPNHYHPVWKRAEAEAPAGSQRPKKTRRKSPALAETIYFEAGNVRLTASEHADITAQIGDLAWPFFDGLRRDPPDWSEDTWRSKFADQVEFWASDDDAAPVPALTDEDEPVC